MAQMIFTNKTQILVLIFNFWGTKNKSKFQISSKIGKQNFNFLSEICLTLEK